MNPALRAVGEPSNPAVERIAARLMDRAESIAQRMVERYREEIADYRLADEAVLTDVQVVSLANLKTTVRAVVGDESAIEETMAQTRAGAARRVRQEVSLNSFLHACRLFGQTIWESVLEEVEQGTADEREAALEMAAGVMRYVDQVSTVAAEGYLNEVQALWTDREVVHRDLLEDLISGRGENDRVRSLARTLKVDLSDRYVVIAARGDDPPLEENFDHPLAARVARRRIVEAARAALHPQGASLLVGMRQGEVVALYPVKGLADTAQVQRDADAFAVALADHDVTVGIGGNHPGLTALADSYAEARDAVDIARSSGIRGRAVLFDQVLLEKVIRSTPHAERILDSTLRPLLEYDDRRQAELVPTLRAYVGTGFNLTKAAELLNVHPNTVVYRLRRVRELSGRDPHDADDLLLLFFGMKLHELRT